VHLEKHHWRYLGLPGVGLRSFGADAVLSGQAGEHSRGVQRGRVVRRLGARIIAKHLEKHVPGNPSFVV
jgi:hypothetical protein